MIILNTRKQIFAKKSYAARMIVLFYFDVWKLNKYNEGVCIFNKPCIKQQVVVVFVAACSTTPLPLLCKSHLSPVLHSSCCQTIYSDVFKNVGRSVNTVEYTGPHLFRSNSLDLRYTRQLIRVPYSFGAIKVVLIFKSFDTLKIIPHKT